MLSMKTENVGYAVAAFLGLGGLMGYVRKGSKVSLIAGSAVGAMYAVASYVERQGCDFGHVVGLTASTLLLGSSVPRALKGRKPVPCMLSAIGVGTAILYGKLTLNNHKSLW
ncbi:hypothetical protein SJAG_04515 [Schizosaccharomyces japonicus yFS275]|uniref:Transmembrane protein 14 n=1 Tax=Schizosaccharomyces japonicus (strain yFS275 / FY16936) TaxID=402676 RepID=B6K712_SCHJY|nr:hypothetical protein SJAG_04515 [Schizosaccharomyces japonicus yFS275]EEB09316.1 hypothetical protein SJAG_04515 [Schizosaccharomyces japonicus yFS275]